MEPDWNLFWVPSQHVFFLRCFEVRSLLLALSSLLLSLWLSFFAYKTEVVEGFDGPTHVKYSDQSLA